MNIGYKLEEQRKKAGYTQAEAADLLGISRSSIIRYENDYEIPTMSTFLKMANLYDFDVYDVLGVNDPLFDTMDAVARSELRLAHLEYMERHSADK